MWVAVLITLLKIFVQKSKEIFARGPKTIIGVSIFLKKKQFFLSRKEPVDYSIFAVE